ncbi:putative 3-deoxy-D-manno-octulosonic acid transferase, mitochondrial [Holospora elegans E1]|uniref:3-deoxy-D-manno-octulosonic acid transferase n=1 Tax=Holospora elegans E1 TaxID=1427503 RepID=A0A023DYW5_9PROT|nr:glycosyltransferase N-terminal domain-containing protein [Holospora elegans]GAJ46195.1 putative 3-deoxy-D-manno-octulosonic acid transferase, mitochondrial [Holospora elegans E1]
MNHHSHTLPPRPAPSLFFRSVMKLYSIFSVGAIPLFWIIAKKRLNAKKEDPKKVQHRFGITNVQRPKGPIIWLHAASIGETRMALSIAYKILQDHEKSYILITTQTLGAQTIVENIPRIIHQMAPFDSRVYVKRFFLYWRPSCAFILESERWPNLLYEAFKHHIPLIGINTHVSEKSLRRWSILKLFFSELLGLFSVCFTPSKKIKEYLMHASFGKGLIHLSPSLKYVLPSTVCANTHSPEKFSSVWSKKNLFLKDISIGLLLAFTFVKFRLFLKFKKIYQNRFLIFC